MALVIVDDEPVKLPLLGRVRSTSLDDAKRWMRWRETRSFERYWNNADSSTRLELIRYAWKTRSWIFAFTLTKDQYPCPIFDSDKKIEELAVTVTHYMHDKIIHGDSCDIEMAILNFARETANPGMGAGKFLYFLLCHVVAGTGKEILPIIDATSIPCPIEGQV